MRKLYLLLFITFFSCSENKLSINKETILKYNIVSEYGDIADTLNVYFEKSFETKLNVSNLKKNKSIVLITKPNIENDFISIQLKDSLITHRVFIPHETTLWRSVLWPASLPAT